MQVEFITNWEGYMSLGAVVTCYQDFELDDADNAAITQIFKDITDRITIETRDGHNYTIRANFRYRASIYDMNNALQELDQYLYDIEQ
jgi:mevalonate pyrophosphate decarboxylase